jgi:hypothetical protein
MAHATQKIDLVERRKPTVENLDDLWQHLTLAQKFAASSLTQFGYELIFIRDFYEEHMAVLSRDDSAVIISKSGEINTHPKIKMRIKPS